MVRADTLVTMSREEHPCPLDPDKVIERYFLEHRAKLIDLAAFLDRIDRAGGDREDFRIRTMMRGIRELATEEPGRARRVQEIFSDQSRDPIDKAPMKGAMGAPEENAE